MLKIASPSRTMGTMNNTQARVIRSKSTLKTFSTITAILLLAASLSSCASSSNSGSITDDPESVILALDEADKIVAKKKMLSFGDEWAVTADGQEVGVIRGEAVYLIGDTYSLFSGTDTLVGREAEGYRVVNHRAKIYDEQSNIRGEIKEKLSFTFAEYEILNGAGKVVGNAKQKFSASMKFDVSGTSGSTEYTVSKALLSLNPKVTIERKNVNSSVEAIDALWLAVIASEVDDANRKKADEEKENEESKRNS